MDEIAYKVEDQLDLLYLATFSSWKVKNFEILTDFGQKMAKNTKMRFAEFYANCFRGLIFCPN